MTTLDIFPYKKCIIGLLSKHSGKEIFDKFVEKVKAYYERPVNTMEDLKKRENKISIGTMWEMVCADWLRVSGKYEAVWTLQEWREYIEVANLPVGYNLKKKDVGIDLIAKSKKYGYHAIQCKWRKKGTITWAMVSTFAGLCSKTGPWSSQVIMTNASGIGRNVPRTKSDYNMCAGTFRGTSREHWMKMCDIYDEHLLEDPDVNKIEQKVDVEAMRKARLERFSIASSSTDTS